MELSSPRYKALAVSAGFTFWFFILTSIFSIFTIEYLVIFVVIVFPLLQLLGCDIKRRFSIGGLSCLQSRERARLPKEAEHEQ